MGDAKIAWITAGFVVGILIISMVAGGFTYSNLKRQLAETNQLLQQTQTQLGEKTQILADKNQAITNLETQKTDLETEKQGLSSDLEEKKKKLTQKLNEVKTLQNERAVLGECLVGVVGVLDAIKNEDQGKAVAGLLMIENSCRKSNAILKKIEKFPIENEF
jgi:chromosome segregation ATPase